MTTLEEIRQDDLVGKGSNSLIDECFDDKDVEFFLTIGKELKWFYQQQLEFLDQWLGTQPDHPKLVAELHATYDKLKARIG